MKSDVERWFADTKLPAEAVIRRVRDVILGADPRLAEYVKNRTLTFGYRGDMAAFVQLGKKQASLMFNRGARIPGTFRYLEGSGPTARFMRFADVGEVDERASELAAVSVAWCDLVEGAGS